jgi:hypothetical protein
VEVTPAQPALATPASANSTGTITRLAPVLPPDVTQFYFAPRTPRPGGAALEYWPTVLGFAEVVFVIDKRARREFARTYRRIAQAPQPGHPVDWDRAVECGVEPGTSPQPDALWAPLPETLDTGRKLEALKKAFADHVYSSEKLPLFENRELEMISNPGEPEATFRRRCQVEAEKQREQAITLEREKFKPKFRTFNAELPDVPIKGRLPAPPAFDSPKQEEKYARLCADYDSKKAELITRWKQLAEEVVPLQVKPRKIDIRVTHFGLAWVPYWLATSAGKVSRQQA